MSQVRRIHSEALVKEAQKQLDQFLQYHKTPRGLKPLVYRPRNASELISRDLWDPIAKKRILPQSSPTIPSNNKLTQLIQNASSVEELNQVKDQMSALAYHKVKYTKPLHLINYLEKSAELNKFPHALTLIYSQDSLKSLIDSSVLNTILTFLYIQPSKTYESSLNKVQVALKQTTIRSPITQLLRLAIQFKYKPEASTAGLLKKINNDQILSLPKLDTSKAPGASAYQLNKHRHLYLTLKPIEETLSQSERFGSLENVKSITEFVKSYEAIETKLEHENTFELLKANSKFGKPVEEAVEEAEPTEEKSE